MADVSFRQHLAIEHELRWVVSRSGQHPWEKFVEMTPAEAATWQATILNRQGGRQERRANARQRTAEAHKVANITSGQSNLT